MGRGGKAGELEGVIKRKKQLPKNAVSYILLRSPSGAPQEGPGKLKEAPGRPKSRPGSPKDAPRRPSGT